MLRRTVIAATLPFLFALVSSPIYAASREIIPQRPKLVVLLVIDQFRADYLMRFASRFLPAKGPKGYGGFHTLIDRGAYYPLAEYDTLQCMTGPGHATLLTGSFPYQNGIPINNWFDQKTQSMYYCVEDPTTASVGGDPKKPHAGTSPKTLLGTTVSDEYKNAGYPSRVVSVALKDRAAILMGGHRADYAIWHDPKAFQWMTSRKYSPDGELPEWVAGMNEELKKESGQKFTWEAPGKGTGFSDETTEPDAKYLWGMESHFPHHLVKGERRSIYSPYGIEITRRLAERAIEKLKLGQENRTDFLFVSLSAHDYLAHGFGPNSREMEEMTVAEDAEIGKLLKTIDKKVGLDRAIIALSADHGGGHTAEYLTKNGIPAGRIDEPALRAELNELMKKEFGSAPKDQMWVPWSEDFSFYLNHPALDAKGPEARLKAEELLRKYLLAQAGAAFVVTSTDVLLKRVPAGELGRKVLLTYYPERSPDVIMIPKSGWHSTGDYATHLSGYSYDRYVPLVLTGRGLKPGRYAQSAKIVDLAPTLSFLLGTVPPSLSEGRVLSEALK
ncbi:MAG: alkaline phosphatase family protein [Bdellovibrionales bacterium]|nr:alkaline phosphatase family protein [Bdellovibrionales bacterium]